MPAEAELAQFIRSTFRSVWTLELLLHLRRGGGAMRRSELVAALRASEAVVSTAAAALFSAGLVLLDDETMCYAPAAAGLDALVEATAVLYAQKPDAVRRLVVSAVGDPAAAFSDAFRLRRD
ncbi:MAG: hypothetical protein QOI38_122 [Sphingomonadales bacterium]|jgi:hypothetical protein|nr:hypothetical protein [Sphingomonadales bacterium]